MNRLAGSEFHLKDMWRSKSEGTLIGEKLSHYIDLQRWFLGSPVLEVYSMSAPNAVTYFNHPDNHQINLRFANGAISNLNFVMHIAETIAFPKEEDQVWFHNTHGQNVRVAELVAKGLPPEVSASDAFETMT